MHPKLINVPMDAKIDTARTQRLIWSLDTFPECAAARIDDPLAWQKMLTDHQSRTDAKTDQDTSIHGSVAHLAVLGSSVGHDYWGGCITILDLVTGTVLTRAATAVGE